MTTELADDQQGLFSAKRTSLDPGYRQAVLASSSSVFRQLFKENRFRPKLGSGQLELDNRHFWSGRRRRERDICMPHGEMNGQFECKVWIRQQL